MNGEEFEFIVDLEGLNLNVVEELVEFVYIGKVNVFVDWVLNVFYVVKSFGMREV